MIRNSKLGTMERLLKKFKENLIFKRQILKIKKYIQNCFLKS